MILVLLSWIVIGAAALLFGKAITDGAYGDHLEVMGRPDIYIMTGLIFLNVFAQLFSLFYKVAGIACTILGTAGIVIVLVCLYRWLRRGEKIQLFPGYYWEEISLLRLAAVAVCFLLTLVWTLQEPGQYDTGLYHAQAIRWIEEYGVVPGLGNLHMRLAYNSAFMSLQALFSLEWLVGQSLHTLNGFFCLAALVYAFSTIRLRGKGGCQVSDLLKCVMVVYVVQKRYDISSSGTDIWAMLLILYIFIKWSEYREGGYQDGALYGYLCLVSVYAATVKLSAAAVVVLAVYPLYLYIRERNGKAVLGHVAAGLGILLPFLARNVVISGYLVYPYGGLDLFDPDWKMDPEVLASDSLDIKMFARGLRSASEYDNSLFAWIPGWFLKQSVGDRILLVVGVACIPLLLYLLVRSLRGGAYARSALLAAGLVNLLFWFFTAPHMRYGGPYLYVLVVMTFGTAVDFIQEQQDPEPVWTGNRRRRQTEVPGRKALRVAAAVITAVFLLQYVWGLSRIPEMETGSLVRQPGYSAWPATQYPLDNVHIWMPDEGDLIGYAAFPATSAGRQLKVLQMRGESFREGFRHE